MENFNLELHCRLLGINRQEFEKSMEKQRKWESEELSRKEKKRKEQEKYVKEHDFSCSANGCNCIHNWNKVWLPGLHCGSCEVLIVFECEQAAEMIEEGKNEQNTNRNEKDIDRNFSIRGLE